MAKKIYAKSEVTKVTTRSPHFRLVYSHSSRARLSNVDLQLTFSAFVDRPLEDGTLEMVNEDQIGVIMSLHQAKMLSKSLTQAIQEYEKKFGTILSPPKPKQKPADEPQPN